LNLTNRRPDGILPRLSGKRALEKQTSRERATIMGGKGKDTREFRPVKKASDKRRREKAQRKRLLALGVPEGQLNKLNSKQVRLMAMRPAQIKKPA